VHHHDEKASDLTRRDALKLAAGIGAATLIPLVPAEAAQAARKAVAARAAGGPLKFFTPAQHHTVDVLTELIIPADDRSPGAKAAKVADYIDFVLSESMDDVKKMWTEGIATLDASSAAQFGKPFAQATAEQQAALLTEASKNEFSPTTPLEKFFREAKSRTIFGYYTTDIGIHQELKYKGNQFLQEFVGCDHAEHRS
jgi:glucoside 3-dehydrogenase (cytochrome c) hitch-hiker subunit